jgi:hypothetical protein
MRAISLILLVAALILGVGTTFSYGFNKSVCEDSSLAIKDLKNLNLLMSLIWVGESSFKASTVVSQDIQKEIPAKRETQYAVIYAYEGVEIPEFLSANFDRIFRMVASYFKLLPRKIQPIFHLQISSASTRKKLLWSFPRLLFERTWQVLHCRACKTKK